MPETWNREEKREGGEVLTKYPLDVHVYLKIKSDLVCDRVGS